MGPGRGAGRRHGLRHRLGAAGQRRGPGRRSSTATSAARTCSAGCGTAWTPIPFDYELGPRRRHGDLLRRSSPATGHQITFSESGDDSSIQLLTKGGAIEITLDEQNSELKIKVKGKVTFEADGDVEIKAGGLDEARGHRPDDDQGRDRRDQLEDAERWHSRSSWATRSRGSARSTRSRTRHPVRRSRRPPMPFTAPLLTGLEPTVTIGGKAVAVLGLVGLQHAAPRGPAPGRPVHGPDDADRAWCISGSPTVTAGGKPIATSSSQVAMCAQAPGQPWRRSPT